MKKFGLITVIFVFFMAITIRMQGQTTQPQLDQLKLMQQFVGTWQMNVSNDTINIWELQQHGKAFVETGYLVVNGKKSFNYIESCPFSSKENKFKGFALYANGNYDTWIGSFTSEKKMVGDLVRDFNPAAVIGKFEAVIETPSSITYTILDTKGVKTAVLKFTKAK